MTVGRIEAVRQALASTPVPAGADVAVGVAGHGQRLIGQPLSGGARWTFVHNIDSRPIIAGGVVVAAGGGELFALDARDGHRLWARPIGALGIRGAGDDGTFTVVTMTRAGGPGSTLLAVGHDGSVLRQIEADVALGSPSVVSHLAFVPWSNQYVSVLDVSDGRETARLLLRETTSHAWTSGGALYFGELGMFRFDEKIKDASKGHADHVGLPTKTLPGQPLFFAPGADVARSVATAADETRLYARPSRANAPLALDSDRFYATYFRLVFGLTAHQARLAWVHVLPVDAIGGAAGQGSLVLCDTSGKLTALDAQGGGVYEAPPALGEALESCVVQVDAFVPTGNPASPGPLVGQIRLALQDRDRELASGQTFMMRELATLNDEAGTEILLEMATDSRLTPAAQEEIRTALAGRRSGARYYVATLDKHYDFLRDVAAPPVGPLAIALTAMKDPGAAHALALHLFEPADSDKDLLEVARALVTLAGPAEAPLLAQFFALYRDAPPEPEEIPLAAGLVAEALLRVGGKEGDAIVHAALAHAGTNPHVRAKIQALTDANVQRAAPSTKPSSTSRE